MKKKISTILFILLLALGSYAQRDTRVNVDLGLMQNYQGFFKLFDGVVDVGANYNRELFRNFYGGVDFHVGFLRRKNTSARTSIFKPALVVNYMIHVSDKLAIIPQAKLGYAILNISNSEYSYKEMQSGWNPGAELRVRWKRPRRLDFYLFGRFDYISLAKDESFTKLEYYRQVYLTSFGFGVHIKSAGK